MRRFILSLTIGILVLTSAAWAQDTFDYDGYGYDDGSMTTADGSAFDTSGSTLDPSFETLNAVPASTAPYVTTNTGAMVGQQRPRMFRGFFFGGSAGYEMATVALGNGNGFLRVGALSYRLVNLQMAQQQPTSMDATTSTSPTARQVVAQFQAQLVALDGSSQLTDTTGLSSTTAGASTVAGIIQGAIVMHGPPPPPRPMMNVTTMGITSNVQPAMPQGRPGMMGPRGGGPVLEAQIQTNTVSGSFLGLGGGGHRGSGGPRQGRQGMPTR